MSTRNINVTRYDDEYALFGKALPYIAMLIGAGLAFLIAVLTRLGVWAQAEWNNTPAQESSEVLTWIISISCIILSVLAWKLFRDRDQFHHYISWHALITTVLIHGWLIMAVWQDMGEWMFGVPTLYVYFFGASVLGISWCIRRWAFRGEVVESEEKRSDIWEVIGLGKEQSPDQTLGKRLSHLKTTAMSAINLSWIWIIARLLKTRRKSSLR